MKLTNSNEICKLHHQQIAIFSQSGNRIVPHQVLPFIYASSLLYQNLTCGRTYPYFIHSNSAPVDPSIQGMYSMMYMRLFEPNKLPILFTAGVGAIFRFLRVAVLNANISLRFCSVWIIHNVFCNYIMFQICQITNTILNNIQSWRNEECFRMIKEITFCYIQNYVMLKAPIFNCTLVGSCVLQGEFCNVDS